jgi:hypothetical protein
MISVLTAYILFVTEASWPWWILYAAMLGWQIVIGSLGVIATVNKK